MNRLHVHVGVHDLAQSIEFYSALFASDPSVKKGDYAKWMLDDPRVNFAISTRGKRGGLDHLGIQAESGEELKEIEARLEHAELPKMTQTGATCCYAKSDKHWTLDPQGIVWEAFHTLDSAPVYGEDTAKAEVRPAKACCA